MIVSHTGLRGIAALAVMMTHLSWEKRITLNALPSMFMPFNWANYAVDLFFMLSGFVMCWVYFQENEPGVNWGGFIKARAVRILPLYYLTLTPYLRPVFITFHCFGYFHNHGKTLAILIGNLLLLTGFSGEDRWDLRYNPASWSVSVECLAYAMLMPLLVWLFRSHGRLSLPLVVGISFPGLILCHIGISQLDGYWDWSQLGRGMCGFPLGFALCILFLKSKPMTASIRGVIILLLLVVMGCSLGGLFPRLWMICMMPVLVFITAANAGWVSRLFDSPIPQWLGERSYSIYLWHTPVMYVLILPRVAVMDSMFPATKFGYGIFNILVLVSAVFIISELSFRLFENPIRKFLKRI